MWRLFPILLVSTVLSGAPPTVYDFSLPALDGSVFRLAPFKGKVTLLVNIADKTEFSDQLEPLEKLTAQFKDQGFAVIGIPSNDFGAGQPEPDTELKSVYSEKFHVTFPVTGKTIVRGKGQSALYEYLTDSKINKKTGGDVPWNFCKYLVSRGGKVVKRFDPDVSPSDPELVLAIEQALVAKETPEKKDAKKEEDSDDSKAKPTERRREPPR